MSDTPTTFLQGDWKMGNLGSHPDGRTVLLDWAYPGAGPACWDLAWFLALNRARPPMSKEDTINEFRGALEQARHHHGWLVRQAATPLPAWDGCRDRLGEGARRRRRAGVVAWCGGPRDAGPGRHRVTPLDVYAGAAVTWDRSTSLVYQPLAKELVRRVGAPLEGRLVIEAGAGTGCATRELQAVGARVIATDLSHPMLDLNRVDRPPSTVSDITLLPFDSDVADHAVAAFVMNHLPDPALALAELARVVRPGGRIATDVFSNASKSPARDAIDDAAGLHGYTPPDWYDDLRNIYADQIGTGRDSRPSLSWLDYATSTSSRPSLRPGYRAARSGRLPARDGAVQRLDRIAQRR